MASTKLNYWLQLLIMRKIEIIRCVFLLWKKKRTIIGVDFLDLLRRYVIEGQTRLCIISDRHMAIKISMERIFLKPIGYHRYCS